MKLIDDWMRKFPKLWSVRLALLASVLSAADVGFQYWATGKPAWVSIGAMVISLSAAVARVISQPKVTGNG